MSEKHQEFHDRPSGYALGLSLVPFPCLLLTLMFSVLLHEKIVWSKLFVREISYLGDYKFFNAYLCFSTGMTLLFGSATFLIIYRHKSCPAKYGEVGIFGFFCIMVMAWINTWYFRIYHLIFAVTGLCCINLYAMSQAYCFHQMKGRTVKSFIFFLTSGLFWVFIPLWVLTIIAQLRYYNWLEWCGVLCLFLNYGLMSLDQFHLSCKPANPDTEIP